MCCERLALAVHAAGLWTAGSGTIAAPDDLFFLPQRPYMPLGTLREQLTFPDSYAAVDACARPSLDGEMPDGLGASAGAAAADRSAGHKRDDGDGALDGGGSADGSGEGGALLASGAARGLASLRSLTSGGYRRLSGGRSSKLETGGGAGGTLGAELASPVSSPAVDAELQGLLDTVCLPNLLSRYAH
jgi:hypothetical protein